MFGWEIFRPRSPACWRNLAAWSAREPRWRPEIHPSAVALLLLGIAIRWPADALWLAGRVYGAEFAAVDDRSFLVLIYVLALARAFGMPIPAVNLFHGLSWPDHSARHETCYVSCSSQCCRCCR